MTRIALILVLLITPTAWAQTDVRLAYVLRTMILPTANGLSVVAPRPAVQVPPANCVTMLVEARAEMHSIEDVEATMLGRSTWTHKSYASCLFVNVDFSADPTVAAQPEETCVLEAGDGFDWSSPCP